MVLISLFCDPSKVSCTHIFRNHLVHFFYLFVSGIFEVLYNTDLVVFSNFNAPD